MITDEFDICGADQYLRVEEMPAVGTRGEEKEKRRWDLMLDPEFVPLAEEMARRFEEGIKTTVMIWGYFEDKYDPPWQDGEELVMGELALRAYSGKEGTKGVLIFHQESISETRKRRIKRSSVGSELYDRFQEKNLGYTWTCDTKRVNGEVSLVFRAAQYPPKLEESLKSFPPKDSDDDSDVNLTFTRSVPNRSPSTSSDEFDGIGRPPFFSRSSPVQNPASPNKTSTQAEEKAKKKPEKNNETEAVPEVDVKSVVEDQNDNNLSVSDLLELCGYF